MNRKLFVGNIPFQTSEDDLQTLFGQAGPVESVRVMRDNATGRARGFAFVEMQTEDGASAAIEFSVTPTAAGSYAFQSYARVMYSSTNSTASRTLTAQ